MKKVLFYAGAVIVLVTASACKRQESPEIITEISAIYHDDWIDLNKNGRQDPYENPNLDIEKRIDDLLHRMTIEEKTCQMTTLYGFGRVLKDEIPTPEWETQIWKDGIGNIDEHLNGLDRKETETEYSWPPSKHAEAINTVQRFFVEETRLGIPVDFTNEGIRGICHQGGTSFPPQIGIGSTWNKDLVAKIGEITAKEGRSLGYTNIYSPILDLARDPRWGRTLECYTEDPFLASKLGLEQVKALQANGVVSTPKHFTVYSIPKGGRDGEARTDPQATRREIEMLYLRPFKTAFVEGKALGTMSSYNDYDGIPITGSRYFLVDLLRGKWGFKGYVVSDSRAVEYIYSKHHIAGSQKDAVYEAVMAGLNIRTDFTEPEVYIEPLRELIHEGRIPIKEIDERVRPILRVKYLLGLFDKPYLENPEKADEIVARNEHQKVALQASRESLILLKNENSLLPLNLANLKNILVVGPNADAEKSSISRYGPNKIDVISVLEGIQQIVPENVRVVHEKGCDIYDQNWPESQILPQPMSVSVKADIDRAVSAAMKSDVIIAVLGENEEMVGESKSVTSLDLAGYQLDLIKALQATGKPVIAVLINGRPLTINWLDRNIPAIIESWFPGAWGGRAVAEVLFGEYNPGGKLPITFPKTVGQLPLNFPYKPGSHAGSKNNTRIKGVLYPFGYGLSYTKFEYSLLKITPETQTCNGNITVTCTIQNTGSRAGDEVVQLYVRDLVSSVTTYVKNLRGFERIHLKPGETKTVSFTLFPDDLSLPNRQMEWIVEPGDFKVMIGASSEDIRLKGNFTITN